MDPTANLDEQRQLSASIIQLQDQLDQTQVVELADTIVDQAVRLAELVQALDTWLSTEGAWPAPWATFRGRKAERG